MLSKRIFWWLLALALVPASALIGGHAWLQTTDGKRWLADQIEKAFSTPDRVVSIGSLEGAIPFSPEVSDVGFSDSEGRWSTVDRTVIRLDPMALFHWEARFEVVEVGRVAMLRLPTTSDSGTEDLSPTAFSWPDFPIPVKIERLNVVEVAFNASLLGEAALFSVEGAARLGDPTNGLSLDLAIVRTDDTPGSLIAQMRYVPDTQRLTTKLRLDEPEGGMLARLAGLAGLPAVTADLSGDGPLDDWRAELILDGGADLKLAGSVAILSEETGRRVTLEATGRFAALANDALLPLVDTETSLGVSVLVGADDRLSIDRFDLAGAFGEASLTGEIDLAGENSDIALTMVPGEPDRFARLTDAASWSGLRLSATLKGTLLEPTLALSIDGASVAYGDVALESFVATVEAAAAGPLTDGRSRIDVAADLTIEGMDPGAVVPPGLLESQIHIAARGSVTPSGRVVADSLTVDAPAVRLAGEGAGEGWGVDSATFVGALSVADLARFDTLVDQTLAGATNLEVSADWDGTRAAIRASAEVERLSTGVAGLDALLGAAPQIALDASFDTDGTVGIESLELSGSGLLLWVSGEIGADALGIDWRLSLADLAAVAPALDGSVAAVGRLTGMPDDPAATARLDLTDALLAGYSVSEARLDADFTGLVTRPAGNVALEGKIAGLPARARTELKIEEDDVIRIDGLALELASLTAEGAITLNSDHTASGQVSASIGKFHGSGTSHRRDPVRDGRRLGVPVTGRRSADGRCSDIRVQPRSSRCGRRRAGGIVAAADRPADGTRFRGTV